MEKDSQIGQWVAALPYDCEASEFWVAEAMDAGFSKSQAKFILSHTQFTFPNAEWTNRRMRESHKIHAAPTCRCEQCHGDGK